MGCIQKGYVRIAICLALIATIGCFAAPVSFADEVIIQRSVSSDTQYVNWESSDGKEGHQLYNPVTIAVMARKDLVQYGLSVRSGYVDSYRLSDETFLIPGLEDFGKFGNVLIGEYEGQTDTVAQLQLQYLGLKRIVPYFTFGLNLPTGHETLKTDSTGVEWDGSTIREDGPTAVGDGDVVFLSRFGEGLNVIVGGGASMLIAPNASISLGGTYIFRGKHFSSLSVGGGTQEYDPGGQLSLNAGINWGVSDWAFAINGAYRTEEESNRQGTGFIQAATIQISDTFSIDGTISHEWSGQHMTSLFGSYTTMPDDNQFSDTVDWFDGLDTTFYDGRNSDVYEVALSHNYQITPSLGVFARASWRERPLEDLNGTSSSNNRVPRTRHSIEGGVDVKANEWLAARVSLGRLRVKDHETDFAEEVETDGWFGSFATTVRW